MKAEVVFNLIHTTVLLLVLLGAVRLIGKRQHSIRAVLFAFAVASVLLSDLYWLAYDILRPGTRMPFAANEIGEWAMFLLLGAALARDLPTYRRTARWQMLGAAAFAAACVGLWIAWSGEWMEDILTGAVYGYMLCCLAARIKNTDVFTARQWALLGAACLVLIAAQAATFFVPEGIRRALDLFCYFVLFAVCTALIVRAVLSIKNGEMPNRQLCLCFAAHAWTVTTLYMSEGGFYAAATLLSTLCFVLMLLALQREAEMA